MPSLEDDKRLEVAAAELWGDPDRYSIILACCGNGGRLLHNPLLHREAHALPCATSMPGGVALAERLTLYKQGQISASGPRRLQKVLECGQRRRCRSACLCWKRTWPT